MPLPIEFYHEGKPASANGSWNEKKQWKLDIAKATNDALVKKFLPNPVPKPHLTKKGVAKAYGGQATIKVFFFPHSNQYIDIDNGLKYTIDGIAESLMTNDKYVTRIISERFLPMPGTSVVAPLARLNVLTTALSLANTPTLMAGGGVTPAPDVTAIKIETYQSNGGKYW
ncbi:hypothetical protein ACXZ1M_20505 [Duganella sp. PWIR1]